MGRAVSEPARPAFDSSKVPLAMPSLRCLLAFSRSSKVERCAAAPSPRWRLLGLWTSAAKAAQCKLCFDELFCFPPQPALAELSGEKRWWRLWAHLQCTAQTSGKAELR